MTDLHADVMLVLMTQNWWGVIVSFAFVFGILGIAGQLLKRELVSSGVSRKIVHIGVAHWWLLAMYFFDEWPFAVAVPAVFVAINLASYLFRLLPAMEHEVRSRNLGTVYFPISLVVLALWCWYGSMPAWVGGMGILILGYGDGFAALFGENFGKRSVSVFGNSKSLVGTVAMFVASLAVVFVFVMIWGPTSQRGAVFLSVVVTAAVATVIEFFTPFGIDNLTIPIVSAGLYLVVFA